MVVSVNCFTWPSSMYWPVVKSWEVSSVLLRRKDLVWKFSSLKVLVSSSKLLPVLNTVLGWISSNMPAIVDTISGVIDNIVSFVEPLITVVQTLFQSFTDGEGTTGSAFATILETISGVIDAVQTVIQTFVDLVSVIWADWGKDIVTTVTTQFNNMMTVIQDVLSVINDVIGLFVQVLKGDWEGAFESLKNIASDGWQLVKDIFSAIVEPIANILSNIISKTTEWAANMVAKAKETASNFVNNIIQGIKELPSNIYNAIRNAIDRVSSWGREMLSAATSAMATLVHGIVNSLSGLPNQMVGVGRNLVQGIWSGINDSVAWVLNKIRGFGDQVLAGIKRIFGIASPSKLMRDEVGKYLAEGIGVGFEDEMQSVNKQIQDAINTDFNVNADVLSNIRSNPAYAAAAVEGAPSMSVSSPITVSYGDIVIEGNATQETVNDIRAVLGQNQAYLQDLVLDIRGINMIEDRIDMNRRLTDQIANVFMQGAVFSGNSYYKMMGKDKHSLGKA